MRRADRLFSILQLLRTKRVITAARMARELEVSERTIYRDVRDLVVAGVPIEGEAGVGYALARGFDLPPLMFTKAEIEAVVLGVRMVRAWGDAGLADAARAALARIDAALPSSLRGTIEATQLYAPDFHVRPEVRRELALCRSALDQREKLALTYRAGDGSDTERVVRPLALSFFGSAWLLTAWCELREGFRHFRLDRIRAAQRAGERFEDEPGRSYADFLASMGD